MKRTDYISWDEYFMGVALLAARRSKDPNTQVGACIVSPENIILSTGYNGLPCCCSDDVFPWEREGAETKYPYVVHAELNAILNAGGRVLRGARLYVALFPCNECAKAIIQSGIREIIYFPTNTPKRPTSVPQSACWTPPVCTITLCRRSLPPSHWISARRKAPGSRRKATRTKNNPLLFRHSMLRYYGW